MPSYNSYILYSGVSAGYLSNLNTVFDAMHIPQWQRTNLPVHLTLGQCFSSNADKKIRHWFRTEIACFLQKLKIF